MRRRRADRRAARDRARSTSCSTLIPELTAAERYRLYADTLRRFAAVGITGAHVMDGDLATLDLLRELEANGDLATRLVAPFWIKPDMTRGGWEQFAPTATPPGAAGAAASRSSSSTA